MINLFKKNKIKKGDVYAVQTGDYVGEMLIFIDDDEEFYMFLSSPKMINREIPKDKFDFGKENEIIEYVETLPRNIFKVVEKQFRSNQE
jgi:hypothetical protein